MMKKYKIAIIFLLIFPIFFFPIYNYTKIKLAEFNLNENLEIFELNTLVKFPNINQFKKELENNFTELLNEIDNNKNYIISSNYSNLGINIIISSDRNVSNNNKTNLDFIIPTESLFSGLTNFVNYFDLNGHSNCGFIRYAESKITKINTANYKINNKLTQKKISSGDDISLIFRECLEKILTNNNPIFIGETLNFFIFFGKDEISNKIKKLIDFKNSSFTNDDIDNLINKYLFRIEKYINENLNKKKFFEFSFSDIYNYHNKTKYVKNFSYINVSLLLTFLINTIFILFIYFLSFRIHFFKKFF